MRKIHPKFIDDDQEQLPLITKCNFQAAQPLTITGLAWHPLAKKYFPEDLIKVVTQIAGHQNGLDMKGLSYVKNFSSNKVRNLLIVLREKIYIPELGSSLGAIKIKGVGQVVVDKEEINIFPPAKNIYTGRGYVDYKINWRQQGEFHSTYNPPWFQYGYKYSSALNEFKLLVELQTLKFSTPTPLGLGQYSDWRIDNEFGGFVVTGYFNEQSDLFRLENYGSTYRFEKNISPQLTELGRLLRSMHDRGFCHGQPHIGNISVWGKPMFLDWETGKHMGRCTDIQKAMHRLWDLDTVMGNIYLLMKELKERIILKDNSFSAFLKGYFFDLPKKQQENLAEAVYNNIKKVDLRNNKEELDLLQVVNVKGTADILNSIQPFLSFYGLLTTILKMKQTMILKILNLPAQGALASMQSMIDDYIDAHEKNYQREIIRMIIASKLKQDTSF